MRCFLGRHIQHNSSREASLTTDDRSCLLVDYAPAWLMSYPQLPISFPPPFFLAWLIVVIPYGAWINLTGIWLQSGENAISPGKSACRKRSSRLPPFWEDYKPLGNSLTSLIPYLLKYKRPAEERFCRPNKCLLLQPP